MNVRSQSKHREIIQKVENEKVKTKQMIINNSVRKVRENYYTCKKQGQNTAWMETFRKQKECLEVENIKQKPLKEGMKNKIEKVFQKEE